MSMNVFQYQMKWGIPFLVFSELFVNCLLGDAYWKHPSIDFREGIGGSKITLPIIGHYRLKLSRKVGRRVNNYD